MTKEIVEFQLWNYGLAFKRFFKFSFLSGYEMNRIWLFFFPTKRWGQKFEHVKKKKRQSKKSRKYIYIVWIRISHQIIWIFLFLEIFYSTGWCYCPKMSYGLWNIFIFYSLWSRKYSVIRGLRNTYRSESCPVAALQNCISRI